MYHIREERNMEAMMERRCKFEEVVEVRSGVRVSKREGCQEICYSE